MGTLPPAILAHGGLGYWDDLIFISIVAIFIAMMGVSWFRSRAMEQDIDEPHDPASEAEDHAEDIQPPDRFELD